MLKAPLIQNFRYRPDVDGLRAIAVLAVVFFHANLGLPGGYVGVDVFFVISGYLITSLIVNDLERGRFTLAGFWERRARRIIPAMAVVVLATLIAGGFLLLPKDYEAFGQSTAYQSVFGANIHFWMTNWRGYFAGDAHEWPLLHTWSLAVEEQFYLIVPLAFAALFRFPLLRTRRTLIALFGAGIFASFFTSLYGVAHYQVAAFYLLPTRAWELLLGSTIAIVPPNGIPRHRMTREIVSYVGLTSLVLSCLLYTNETPFPGIAALPPCLGAALIIWGNISSDQETPSTSLARILAARPVVFIGLISYSFYLWHWPVFAFGRYIMAESLSPIHRMEMVVLAFVLAILSWYFVEMPFRRKVLCATRKSVYGFAGTALAVLFILGIAIVHLHGLPQRLPENLRAALDPRDLFLFAREVAVKDIAAGNLPHFGIRDSHHPVTMLVWGDSHAMSALPAFDALLKKKNMAGRAATHTATPPVLNYFWEVPYGLGKDSLRFNEEVVSYIERQKIPHVVLVACWSGYDLGVQPALLATVKKVTATGAQVWVLLQVPPLLIDVSRLFRRSWTTIPDLNQSCFCSKPGLWNGIADADPTFLPRLKEAGARIIDPRPAFLNAEQDLYQITIDGIILYWDENHLTKSGAEKMLVPVLEKSFSKALMAPVCRRDANLLSH